MKKIISVLLAAVMLSASTQAVFANETATTAQEAAAKITAGVVLLEADTSMDGINNATQAEKLQAVEEYVSNYLNGAYENVTSTVKYQNGLYIVVLTDKNSNKASVTINENEFNFVYSVKAMYDEYDSYALDEEKGVITGIRNIIDCVIKNANGNEYKNPAELGNSQYSSAYPLLPLSEDRLRLLGWSNGSYEGKIFRSNTEWLDGSINDTYVYETSYRVESYSADIEGKSKGADYYSSLNTVSNRLYELAFTAESDGLYYKTSTGWSKAAYEGDTDVHNYRVVVNGDKAEIFVDGVNKTGKYTMPAATSTSDEISFAYSFGEANACEKVARIECKLDYFRLYNTYENQVFIEDFDNFDDTFAYVKNTDGSAKYYDILSDENAYNGQEVATNAHRFNKGFAVNDLFRNTDSDETEAAKSAHKWIYYKVPKNAYIKNIKVVTSSRGDSAVAEKPYHLWVSRYGYAAASTNLINAGTKSLGNHKEYFTNVGGGYVYSLSDSECQTLDSAKNYSVVMLALSRDKLPSKFFAITGVEIEYDYFYDTDMNPVIADDMTNITSTAVASNTELPFVNGWQNWAWDSSLVSRTGSPASWKINHESYIDYQAEPYEGHVLRPAADTYANMSRQNIPTWGDSYTMTADIWLDKDAAEVETYTGWEAQSDIAVSVKHGGKRLAFFMLWTGEKYQMYYHKGGSWTVTDLPSDVTLTDDAFNNYKGVVTGDTATIYINDVAVVSDYELSSDTAEEIRILSGKNAVKDRGSKAAIKNFAILEEKNDIAETVFIDGIDKIGAADYTEGDYTTITVSFAENKVGKEFNAYCALYNNKGKLISTQMVNVPVDGQTEDSIVIPVNDTGYKLFFWDSDMNPVNDVLSY